MTQLKQDNVYSASHRGINRLIFILLTLVCMAYSGISAANQDLFNAAKKGNTTQLEQALSSGVDIDGRDDDGYTALMWAARRGHLSAVRLLAEKGADLKLRTPAGSSAYKLATNFGRYEVADYLKQQIKEQRRAYKIERRKEKELNRNRNSEYGHIVRLSSCDKKINVMKLVKRAFFDQEWNDIVTVNKTTVSASFETKKGHRYRAKAIYNPENYSVKLVYADEPFGKRAWLARVGKRIRSNFADSCF